jgi:ABC-type nitrate/sulfonate/bicarbonate transport system substrate-binding protein
MPRKTYRYPMRSLAAAALLAGFVAGAPTASQAADKLTFALPGIPPVYAGVMAYVARDAGFYKKYGLDVTLKPMNSGVAAAKAVVSGAVDVSLSPTTPVITMVSNAGVPLVGIWGMEKPDWLIGSMDPSKSTCMSMKGQAVGVDSPRGARWIQLANMARKCKLMPDRDIKTVNLSSNVGAAMVAGRLTFGVLHMDDIAVIERESGKKLTIVSRLDKVSPGTHYLMLVTTKKTIATKRNQLVRLLAAHIDAIAYMRDPANADKVAKMARPTGRKLGDAKNGLMAYNKFEFWPNGRSGLNKKRLAKTIKIQIGVGKRTKGRSGVNPAKQAVSIDALTTDALWTEAMALAKSKK